MLFSVKVFTIEVLVSEEAPLREVKARTVPIPPQMLPGLGISYALSGVVREEKRIPMREKVVL